MNRQSPRAPAAVPDPPAPPDHLSAESQRWWTSIVEVYVLRDHHLKLLQLAAEAWDRSQQARRAIRKEGAFTSDRFGQRVAHPGVTVERQARNEFRLLLRELGLDAAPEDSRPPRMY